jgi:hypothetical protein
LNLKYDEPLSNVPFNFNVRRYTKELGDRCTMTLTLILALNVLQLIVNEVGQCRLTVSKHVLEAPMVAISA